MLPWEKSRIFTIYVQYVAKCHFQGKCKIQKYIKLYHITTHITYCDLLCVYVIDTVNLSFHRKDLCDSIAKPKMCSKFHCSFMSNSFCSMTKCDLFYSFVLWHTHIKWWKICHVSTWNDLWSHVALFCK